MKLISLGLFVFAFAISSIANARPASCICKYWSGATSMDGNRWVYVGPVRFDAERSNYRAKGEKACRELVEKTVLDDEWNGWVSVSACHFVN